MGWLAVLALLRTVLVVRMAGLSSSPSILRARPGHPLLSVSPAPSADARTRRAGECLQVALADLDHQPGGGQGEYGHRGSRHEARRDALGEHFVPPRGGQLVALGELRLLLRRTVSQEVRQLLLGLVLD